MAKRIFELPKEHELTKDQRTAIRKPLEGQYLIFGAPGTGKSVVALHRIKKYAPNHNIIFLTFNHVLNHANKVLTGTEHENKMHTAMSWLYQFQWSLSESAGYDFQKGKMPEINNYSPDYAALKARFKELNADCSSVSFVIDEGQDLPPEWYEAVESLGVENFFVVADQNQILTDQNSNKDELLIVLGIKKDDKEKVVNLNENFRNTTPIAHFSNYFYTDKSSPKPKLPNKPSTHIPILYEYENTNSVKEVILSSYDNDPSKLIGVIVGSDSRREHWAKFLTKDDKDRRELPPVISTYSSDQKGDVNIDFSNGGIVVLNDKSVKGIEFDEVFIITDGFQTKSSDIESLKKRMYVMASRARERLFLCKSSVQKNIFEEILPPPGEKIQIIRNNETEDFELLKRIKI